MEHLWGEVSDCLPDGLSNWSFSGDRDPLRFSSVFERACLVLSLDFCVESSSHDLAAKGADPVRSNLLMGHSVYAVWHVSQVRTDLTTVETGTHLGFCAIPVDWGDSRIGEVTMLMVLGSQRTFCRTNLRMSSIGWLLDIVLLDR